MFDVHPKFALLIDRASCVWQTEQSARREEQSDADAVGLGTAGVNLLSVCPFHDRLTGRKAFLIDAAWTARGFEWTRFLPGAQSLAASSFSASSR
jgi:hypothetical protein